MTDIRAVGEATKGRQSFRITTLHRWGGAAAIAFVVALLLGHPAPSGNEYVYMPLLKSVADPTYLAGDWTLGSGFLEKSVFNTVFSPAVRLVDIVALSWIGRVASWLAIGRLLVAFGERVGSSVLGTVLSVVGLMGIGWSAGVAAASLFGHFQASAVAWPIMLGAFVAAFDRRMWLATLLVGLSASLHPAIGLWVGGALLLATLLTRATRRDTIQWLPLAVLCALPGLVLQVRATLQSSSNAASAEFLALSRTPHHVDPFAFGERGPLILAAMAIAVLAWAWLRRSEIPVRLLGLVTVVLIGVFILGVAARIVGSYELLLAQPFRGLATLLPLTFGLAVSASISRYGSRSVQALWGDHAAGRVFVVTGLLSLSLVLVLWNPAVRWAHGIQDTVSAWSSDVTDLDRALAWVSTNTPPNSTVVSPPWIDELFYLTERPQLVSWEAVTYDRPIEWRERLELTVSDPMVWLDPSPDVVSAHYNGQSLEHWIEVSRLYGADYVITTASYQDPAFSSGSWNVYVLSPGV